MKRLAIAALAAVPALVASCWGVKQPATAARHRNRRVDRGTDNAGGAVRLPCEGGRFVCHQPLAPDNTIPAGCTLLWIVPKTTGACIFELTVGGTNMRLQHEMRVYPGCCGGEAFIGDEDYNGFVDLRYTSDAGDGGLDAAVD